MAFPDGPGEPAPVPPPPDPQAIRACLSSSVVADFDHEWDIVLDQVKHSQNLADLHEFLNKWRHIAYLQMREPDAYERLQGTAEQIPAHRPGT